MTETILTPSQAEALDNRAEQQAAAQYRSICEMLDAVDVDYDRLQELRDERESLVYDLNEATNTEGAEKTMREAEDALAEWDDDNAEELNDLEHAAGDCDDEDDARQRISEDPLSVEVRSGWASPGEELTPDDFRILLCTGGPAVQIRGELDHNGMPCRAWLEYQDWGTPWTQYFGADADRLVQYASHFFG